MDPISVSVVTAAATALKPILERLVESRRRDEEGSLQLSLGERELLVNPEVDTEVLASLLRDAEKLEKASSHRAESSTEAVLERGAASERVGAAALALNPDEVFRRARSRIDLVFRVRLGIAIVMAVVLVGALIGTIVSLLAGNGALAGLLGGAGLADLMGAIVYKPLDRIRKNLVDTQRLDMVHLMAQGQLEQCNGFATLSECIECQKAVWTNVLDHLSLLDKS